jgi:hypothetical protein
MDGVDSGNENAKAEEHCLNGPGEGSYWYLTKLAFVHLRDNKQLKSFLFQIWFSG